MRTKLSLKIDQSVIESAKLYASTHKTSLSKLVEAYLRSLACDTHLTDGNAPGVVGELAGLLKGKEIGSDKQAYRQCYIDYLENKY